MSAIAIRMFAVGCLSMASTSKVSSAFSFNDSSMNHRRSSTSSSDTGSTSTTILASTNNEVMYHQETSTPAATTTETTNLNGLRPQLSRNCLAHQTAKDAGIYIGMSTLLDSNGKSGNCGLGAFTTTRIPFGTYIGEYYGELLSRKQVESRYYNKRSLDTEDYEWLADRYSRSQEVTGSYLLELSNGKFVDAEDGDKLSCRRKDQPDSAPCHRVRRHHPPFTRRHELQGPRRASRLEAGGARTGRRDF